MVMTFGALASLTFALLPNIVWIVGFLISRIMGKRLRYAPFGYVSIALALIVAASIAYGHWFGRWHLRVKEIEYHNDRLPAIFSGFRIVHISDLHLSSFNDNPEKLQTFVDTINARRPDLVCFTGDLVTIGKEEAEPYTQVLKGIDATYGVFSVFGNHDLLIYNSRLTDRERPGAVEEMARYQRDELGWTLLRDSSKVIRASDGSTITIIGVNNKNCTEYGLKTINVGDLPKAMEDVGGFSILLSHDPSHWDAEILPYTDIPLTLSGHTHAAQFSIFGWNPSTWLFKRGYGLYVEDGQTLYVNPGLGCTILPFRVGARPEITVITLS